MRSAFVFVLQLSQLFVGFDYLGFESRFVVDEFLHECAVGQGEDLHGEDGGVLSAVDGHGAMMTRMPRAAALRAKSETSAGVRWAERALTSKGISISSKNLQAFSMTGRSEVEPMMMLTCGFILRLMLC